MMGYPDDMPWLVLRLQQQSFAVPSLEVREVITLPPVASVPGIPGYFRGLINLRGQALPLMDLRKRLGMPSALDQVHAFRDMMVQREHDHRRWLDELEASVREKRPFTLAMDPHQCAFGRWYDSYEAPDPWTKSLLRKFDRPHQRLHGVARQIEALKARGDTQAMAELLGRERHSTLAVLLRLFGELQALILETHREVAMVVERRGINAFAATADEAQSVVSLTADSVQDLPSGMGVADREAITHVARRPGSQELLMLLEPSCLLVGPGRRPHRGLTGSLPSPPH